MRSLIKLTIASLAAIALFAGMASAQTTPKFSGNVGTAFGLYNYGETNGATAAGKAFSEYTTSWESNLRMTMETDKLTAIVRYRARASNAGSGSTASAASVTPKCTTTNVTDSNGDTSTYSKCDKATTTGGNALTGSKLQSGTAFNSNANDIYHEVWWKPADNFSVGFGKFQGQAWSQPFSGIYLVINPIGDGVYWMNWTGISGIDLEFNAGVVQVGLAISSQCKPSCNSGAAATTQSMVPHLTGKFGDIAIRAQLPQTSGNVNCTAVNAGDCKKADTVYTVSGSGFQAGVSWTGMPGLSVALDLSSFTDAKTKLQDQDRARAGTGLTANFAGITFHYFSLKDSTFTKAVGDVGGDTTTSEMTVRYTLPMGSGQIIPEYRTVTADDKAGAAFDKAGKAVALTHTEFRLMGNVNY